MKSSILALAALASSVYGYANESTSVYYLTTTVTALTTYCPGPTVLTHGSLTSTITEATTITITDCPCTAVIPMTVTSSVACATCAVATGAPKLNSTAYSTGSFSNKTMSSVAGITSTAPLGVASPTTGLVTSPSSTTPSDSTFTGAASVNKAMAASGAGLAGLLGFVAYVL